MASIGIGLFVIKMTNNPRAGEKLHNFRRRNLTLHPATKDWFVKIVQTFISSEKMNQRRSSQCSFILFFPLPRILFLHFAERKFLVLDIKENQQ